MSIFSIHEKIKEKLIKQFNQDLYRNFNMTISDADNIYGLYDGNIYKIINQVFKRHGPHGLRKEMQYIIQFFKFLHLKIDKLLSLKKEELPFPKYEKDKTLLKYIFANMYYRRSYRHYEKRDIAHPNQLSFKFYNFV